MLAGCSLNSTGIDFVDDVLAEVSRDLWKEDRAATAEFREAVAAFST